MLTFISGYEIVIIFLVVLLLFGAKRLPELARGLGKGMQEFRRATNEIKQEFDTDEFTEIVDEFGENLKQPLEDTDQTRTKDSKEASSSSSTKPKDQDIDSSK